MNINLCATANLDAEMARSGESEQGLGIIIAKYEQENHHQP
jgi:hypothetical protein